MTRDIRLATGLAIRNGAVLLVASAYRSPDRPLWNLPGGRQLPGELLRQTVEREVAEETGMQAGVTDLAYVSESYDGDVHVVNATFEMSVTGSLTIPGTGDHVVDARWCTLEEIQTLVTVEVVRVPLLEYLRFGRRYRGFYEAGITIRWPEEGSS